MCIFIKIIYRKDATKQSQPSSDPETHETSGIR